MLSPATPYDDNTRTWRMTAIPDGVCAAEDADQGFR